MTNVSNPQLLSFLSSLSNSIKENTLSPDQLLRVTEFFIKFSIYDSLEKSQKDKIASDDELMKYLFFGYYAYRFILNK